MEVLSIFSNNKSVVDLFDDFILHYHSLKLDTECEDTKYFINLKTGRNEIYFHFIFNSKKHELIRDYTKKEQKFIFDFFENKEFYFFDIQYRDELFLNNLLIDFQNFIKDSSKFDLQKILINHCIKGIVPLQDFEATY